jgi:hypothetical protein
MTTAGSGLIPALPCMMYREGGEGGVMRRLLCLVMGHQWGPVPLRSNRFACKRCGRDLRPTIPTWPLSVETRTQRFVLRGADDGAATSRVPWSHSSLVGRELRLVGGRSSRFSPSRAFPRR